MTQKFRRQFWQSPRLHDNTNPRGVGWLELFFDLFFVAVIAQLVHGFSEHFDSAGLRTFMLLFIPIWWVWIGDTFYSERFETEGIEMRLYTYLLMLPVLGMAVYAHHGSSSSYVGYALSYATARGVITLMWAWATVTSMPFRPIGKRFVTTFCFAIALIVLSTATSGLLRFVIFGTALALEMLIPLTTVGLQRNLPAYSESKLPKRFGLFTLIVLGEMVVGVVNGLSDLDGVGIALFVYAALGVAVGLGLWWLYFDFIARRRPKVGSCTFLWS
jgi:low temperature requirement protein LtrA